ncbi:MAG: DUF2520 domain-containing protein [Phycisphaerales bacterium]|nr:DUF2520 domain-containing protein [Phycisphaerales bacterium]
MDSLERPITISIIGAGKVANLFILHLVKSNNVKIVEIASSNYLHAVTLAELYNFQAVVSVELLAPVDVYLIAVPDDRIESVAYQIPHRHATFIHCSGATALSVLPSIKKAVSWPLYSISKRFAQVQGHKIPFFIESSDEATFQLAKCITETISHNIFSISWKQRQYLHIVAVMVNNFTNVLYTVGAEICDEHQMPFSYVYPIIQQLTEEIRISPPHDLQTGPAFRGDMNTIAQHLERLENKAIVKKLYQCLSDVIQQRYDPDKETNDSNS